MDPLTAINDHLGVVRTGLATLGIAVEDCHSDTGLVIDGVHFLYSPRAKDLATLYLNSEFNEEGSEQQLELLLDAQGESALLMPLVCAAMQDAYELSLNKVGSFHSSRESWVNCCLVPEKQRILTGGLLYFYYITLSCTLEEAKIFADVGKKK